MQKNKLLENKLSHIHFYKNLTFGTAFLLSFLFKAYGQDAVFSQFMFHQLSFNPANTGNLDYARFVSGYRNQWPSLNNAYISYYASYDQFVDKISSGIGLAVNRDIQGGGSFSKTSIDLSYCFPVELNNNLKMNLGIKAGVVQKRIGASNIKLPDSNPFFNSTPQVSLADQSKIYSDFSVGTSFFYNEQYTIGLAVNHINMPNEALGGGFIVRSPVGYTLQIGAHYPNKQLNRTNKKLKFEPGVIANWQKGYNYIGWGSTIQYSSIIAGIWFRNNFFVNLNTIIFQVAYSHLGTTISYSYDFWMPNNYQQLRNIGAHEVTFIYLFKYNDPKKKMKAIKCPKF